MGLTHHALELMGMRHRRADESLQAAFSSIHAFEVHGISSSSGLLIGSNGSVAGVDYRLALAETLNAAAQLVAKDNFAEDEPTWVKERKCSPPYLLIHVGPTKTHEMTRDYLSEKPFGIQTYEAFIPARQELGEMEAKVIPSVLSALSCIFGTLPNPVRFRQLERAVAGKTADGRTVFDFGLEFNVEVRVGHALPLPELKDRINRAADLATRMNPQRRRECNRQVQNFLGSNMSAGRHYRRDSYGVP